MNNIYCDASSWSDDDYHKWEQTGRVVGSSGSLFSLQMCRRCGECRKVMYELDKS